MTTTSREFVSPGPSTSLSVNPMLNKLILENLFGHLDENGLLKSRLVCRLWNREANRFLRIQKRVNFSGSNTKHIYSFLNLMKPYFSHDHDTDRDTDAGDVDIPLGRFSIQIWDSESFRSRFLSLPAYSEAFFNNYGQHIKYLQVSFNDFKDTVFEPNYRAWFLGKLAGSLKCLELNGLSSFIPSVPAGQQQLDNEFIFEDGRAAQIFPYLETLIMTDAFDEPDEVLPAPFDAFVGQVQFHRLRKRFTPRFMSDLLRMAPNLKSLTINTFENVSSSLASSTLQILKASCPNQLQHLRLQTYIDEHQLKVVHSCGFRLQICELRFRAVGMGVDIDMDNSTVTLLQEFLRTQAETLRDFTLRAGAFCLNFPREMTRLSSLSLNGAIELNLCVTVGNPKLTDCPSMLPCLQTLILANGASFGHLFPCAHEHHHLTTVNTLHVPEDFSDTETLKQILTQWKSLRCLRLESPPASILNLLWEFGGAIEELELVLGGGAGALEPVLSVPGSGHGLSILNLTELRRLVISNVPTTEPPTILDISDEFAFTLAKKFKRLSSLTLRNAKVSDAALKFITENLQLIHLEINNQYKYN